MRVATQGPFAVGIVRWQWPTPGFTVVVKITYGLDRDGRVEPSPVQLGLCVDSQGIGTGDELEYASDFAPLKARCDVLVVGHARVAVPAASLPVEVCVDDFRKAANVVSPAPARTALLAANSIRCRGGVAGFAPKRATASGWRKIHSLQHFDFGQHNVAPADQQVPYLRSDARMVLSGLLDGVVRRDVQLAGLEPEVFYLPGKGFGVTPRAIQLRRDTLWIHADRALCTLAWRGLVENAPESDTEARLLALVRGLHPRSAESVAAEPVDAKWKEAVDRYAIRPGPPAEREIKPRTVPGSASLPPELVRTAPLGAELPTLAKNGGTMVLQQPPAPAPASDSFEDEEVATGQIEWSPKQGAPENEPGQMRTAQLDWTPEPDAPEQMKTAQLDWSPAEDTVDQPPVFHRSQGTDEAVDEDTTRDHGPAKLDSEPPAPDASDGPSIYGEAEEEEPGPVTPSAGVQLGGMMGGGGLGSMVLTSPTSTKAAVPFDKDEADSEQGATAARQRTAPPPDDEALPFRQDAPIPAAPPPFVAPATGALVAPPSKAGDTAVDEEESPQSITGEVQIGSAKPVMPFQPGASRPPAPTAAKHVHTGTVALPAFPPDASQPPAAAKAGRFGTGTMTFAAIPREGTPSKAVPFDEPGNQAGGGAPVEPPLPAMAPPEPVIQSVVPAIVPSASWHPPPVGAPAAESVRPAEPTDDGVTAESTTAKGDGLDLTLETYATIKARLWDGTVPAEEVLKEYAFDEPKWRAIEAKQARAIARDAATGRAQLAIDVRNAIAEARRKLAVEKPEQTEIDLEQFAEILVAVEEAPNEAAVLREREIEPAEWERLQRHFGQQASTDRQLAEELRTKIAKARRALRDGDAGK